MANVLNSWPPIQFRVPEVLYVVQATARGVTRRQVAALRRQTLAQRVIQIERKVIRESFPERCLQTVVFHRLIAIDIKPVGGAEQWVRTQTRLPVYRQGKSPLEREAIAICADIANLHRHNTT